MSADLRTGARDFPKAPEPFGQTSNRSSYTPREVTERTLARLLESIREFRPVTIVSGPPGLGKTLLLHVLAHRLDEEVHPVFLPYGALTPEDFCVIVLNELDSAPNDDPVGMLKAYALHLQEIDSALLLLIDDAGAMPAASLRWCCEFARSMSGAVRCIFAVTDDAHSGEVIAALGSDVLEVRLAAPMTRKETDDYVEVQLAIGRASGAVRALFDEPTIARLFEASGGVPRRLHTAAQAVLRQEPRTPPPEEYQVDQLEVDALEVDEEAVQDDARALVAPAIREEIERLRRDALRARIAEPPVTPQSLAPAISRRAALMAGVFAAAVVVGLGIAVAVRPLARWVFPDDSRTVGPPSEATAIAPAPKASAPSVQTAPAPELPGQIVAPRTTDEAVQREAPFVAVEEPRTAEPVDSLTPPQSAPAPRANIAVNINATPWATVEVDGETLGETPLAGVPIASGLHTFRAHLPDGQVIERTVEIDAENRFVVFEAPPPAAP